MTEIRILKSLTRYFLQNHSILGVLRARLSVIKRVPSRRFPKTPSFIYDFGNFVNIGLQSRVAIKIKIFHLAG